MKFVAGAAAALAVGLLVGINPAAAAIIDLSAWTCAKFQAADKDEIGMILTWLDGYYREEDEPPVIDTEKFASNAKKLNQYCSAHPESGLITAADEVLSK
jgi:acid stress chaperone HdeB